MLKWLRLLHVVEGMLRSLKALVSSPFMRARISIREARPNSRGTVGVVLGRIEDAKEVGSAYLVDTN